MTFGFVVVVLVVVLVVGVCLFVCFVVVVVVVESIHRQWPNRAVGNHYHSITYAVLYYKQTARPYRSLRNPVKLMQSFTTQEACHRKTARIDVEIDSSMALSDAALMATC